MAEDLTLAGLDAPRPLPPALRDRLEAALLAAAGSPAGVATVGEEDQAAPSEDPLALDAPRPLPPAMRGRLESAVLAATGARPAAARWGAWSRPLLAVAAVLALLLGSVAVLNLGGRSQRDVTAAGPEATSPSTAPPVAGPEAGFPLTTGNSTAQQRAAPPTSRPAPQGRSTSSPTTVPTTPPATEPRLASPPAGGGDPEPAPTPQGTGTGPEAQDPGPPPPFASPSSPAPSSDQAPAAMAPAAPGSQGGSAPPPPRSSPPPASGPALRVGFVGGDAAQEAGFRAYVALLNREGGVRGRPVEAVPVAPGAVDSSTLVTVNLSSRPVATPGGAPGWVGGALLETLTATEDLLPAGGRVFSFASVPERQAHLVVDAVFPDAAPGARAVVYAATDGPYAGKVAAAFRQILTAKGVTVTTVVYDPDQPPALLPTAAEDAAFVSLDPPAAAAFARQARESSYRPARGIAGVASLFDPAVLGDLPEGARVVSPYVVPGGAEGDAIRSGAGGTSAAVLHGWTTAKVLAVALWRSGADTQQEALAALEGMAGYDSGLAPPYETRPQTRSRTPEGVVFEVRSGAFAAQGAFRRDPY